MMHGQKNIVTHFVLNNFLFFNIMPFMK